MANLIKKNNKKTSGIDIGSEKIFISVEDKEVRNFGTYTESYIEAVKYLKEEGIETVAMEATGVYWITFYDLMVKAGIDVYVVNAASVKNVPGRKTDVQDCQWIQQLHSFGLLKKSFIPEEKIGQLRTYVRIREDHIQIGATHIQHIQKAFILMNIKLHNVITQVQGASGRRIIEAILKGERDANKLVELCETSILKNKREDVIKSLQGNFKREYLFALKQAYEGWKFYQSKIKECDVEINKLLSEMTKGKAAPKNLSKAKKIVHNKPNIEKFHEKMMTITEGKDGTRIPGFTDYTLMKLIAEVGTDLSRWSTPKQFTSWLGLAPGKHTSGTIKKRSKKKINTKAGQLFKESAHGLLKSKRIALGAFARRLRAKRGPSVAIKATARKLAIMFYNIMTKGMDFVEEGIKKYEEKYKESIIKSLNRRAAQFNLELVSISDDYTRVH